MRLFIRLKALFKTIIKTETQAKYDYLSDEKHFLKLLLKRKHKQNTIRGEFNMQILALKMPFIGI